jgi:hemolysin activation/secretion protein
VIRKIPTSGGRPVHAFGASRFRFSFLLWFAFLCSVFGFAGHLFAAAGAAAGTNAPGTVDAGPRFNVAAYKVEGRTVPSPETIGLILSKYVGTNVSLGQIAVTAASLQEEYGHQGYTNMTVSVAPERAADGIVVMHVFEGALPQVLVSGVHYTISGSGPTLTAFASNGIPTTAAATNAPPATNASPRIPVEAYEVNGNDLLSDDVMQSILSKYTGTNVSFDDIGNMLKELTLEYRDRGFDTVSVTTPVQRITNGIIKIQVFEGTLASIKITGNHYYSSNNIMRALPGLKTNMILNSKLFQPELDRANANQDRQISPLIGEGPAPDTSELTLQVKDRLPLHAKMELNNQNSPGTPELRVNSSAVYNDLWQLDHSLGVQYSFSPEQYKQGKQWDFYDLPLVANYSGFYRLPLGNPESVADAVSANPGSFGYDEATRKFNLPPPSGVPELNVYASRSTIDTGVEAGGIQSVLDIPGVREVFQQDFQEDLTVNDDIGFRLSTPLPQVKGLSSTISLGLDVKTYELTSFKTNVFNFEEFTFAADGSPLPPIISSVDSPVPVTRATLQYMPLALRYDGSTHDALGTTAFGLGLTYNAWLTGSGSVSGLGEIVGINESHVHWVALTPSLSRDIDFPNNWVLSLRADGQWSSEPLISNEQFGAGGIASVRGYHEGEVFGDTGWHISAEQKTPPHIVGFVNGNPFTLRAAVYMDYAQTFLLDPQGRPARTPLWGTGFGLVGSIGTRWEARLLFSVPLLNAGTVEAHEPLFDFSLTAQF